MKRKLPTPYDLTPFSRERWKSLDGETRQIWEMSTVHVFRVFRMVYDAAADRYGFPRMRPRSSEDSAIAFSFAMEDAVGPLRPYAEFDASAYDDAALAALVASFAREIIARGDLDGLAYNRQFRQMISNLKGGRHCEHELLR